MAASIPEASWLSWLLFVPVVVGLASGFQYIYGKFQADSWSVIGKFWGAVYWGSRGLIPLAGYSIWFKAQGVAQHSLATAIAWGLGSEMVLRTRFYVADKKTASGETEEIFKGVFDLVHWYQNLLLDTVGTQLAIERQTYVKGLVGSITGFPSLLSRIEPKVLAWKPEDLKQRIQQKLAEVNDAFKREAAGKAPIPGEIHERYILTLGYALLDLVGRNGLKTLVSV